MSNRLSIENIQHLFQQLCADAGRQGIIGFSAMDMVRLLPEQRRYLQHRLRKLGPVQKVTAISLALLYHEQEILAVPSTWKSKTSPDDRWNDYAQAYLDLNHTLNQVSTALATEFDGVVEKATIEGWAGKVRHVADYFPHCVSHRAFAEAAGLGWRGRHGLIVTPEAGPALRFATVFIPGSIPSQPKEMRGCGECHACLDTCPILRKVSDYREGCRQHIRALNLVADVCGICVRICWEQVVQRA